ncbi:hypothetical protein [Aggregatilinea lenta]|uniref:hypothetical protein n=1 Tax=Aggregatilinea lenta TaxID=913108 RepID=UPI0013C2BCC1|nr:hypothetical protein [Aggregatilinea lenta]
MEFNDFAGSIRWDQPAPALFSREGALGESGYEAGQRLLRHYALDAVDRMETMSVYSMDREDVPGVAMEVTINALQRFVPHPATMKDASKLLSSADAFIQPRMERAIKGENKHEILFGRSNLPFMTTDAGDEVLPSVQHAALPYNVEQYGDFPAQEIFPFVGGMNAAQQTHMDNLMGFFGIPHGETPSVRSVHALHDEFESAKRVGYYNLPENIKPLVTAQDDGLELIMKQWGNHVYQSLGGVSPDQQRAVNRLLGPEEEHYTLSGYAELEATEGQRGHGPGADPYAATGFGVDMSEEDLDDLPRGVNLDRVNPTPASAPDQSHYVSAEAGNGSIFVPGAPQNYDLTPGRGDPAQTYEWVRQHPIQRTDVWQRSPAVERDLERQSNILNLTGNVTQLASEEEDARYGQYVAQREDRGQKPLSRQAWSQRQGADWDTAVELDMKSPAELEAWLDTQNYQAPPHTPVPSNVPLIEPSGRYLQGDVERGRKRFFGTPEHPRSMPYTPDDEYLPTPQAREAFAQARNARVDAWHAARLAVQHDQPVGDDTPSPTRGSSEPSPEYRGKPAGYQPPAYNWNGDPVPAPEEAAYWTAMDRGNARAHQTGQATQREHDQGAERQVNRLLAPMGLNGEDQYHATHARTRPTDETRAQIAGDLGSDFTEGGAFDTVSLHHENTVRGQRTPDAVPSHPGAAAGVDWIGNSLPGGPSDEFDLDLPASANGPVAASAPRVRTPKGTAEADAGASLRKSRTWHAASENPPGASSNREPTAENIRRQGAEEINALPPGWEIKASKNGYYDVYHNGEHEERVHGQSNARAYIADFEGTETVDVDAPPSADISFAGNVPLTGNPAEWADFDMRGGLAGPPSAKAPKAKSRSPRASNAPRSGRSSNQEPPPRDPDAYLMMAEPPEDDYEPDLDPLGEYSDPASATAASLASSLDEAEWQERSYIDEEWVRTGTGELVRAPGAANKKRPTKGARMKFLKDALDGSENMSVEDFISTNKLEAEKLGISQGALGALHQRHISGVVAGVDAASAAARSTSQQAVVMPQDLAHDLVTTLGRKTAELEDYGADNPLPQEAVLAQGGIAHSLMGGVSKGAAPEDWLRTLVSRARDHITQTINKEIDSLDPTDIEGRAQLEETRKKANKIVEESVGALSYKYTGHTMTGADLGGSSGITLYPSRKADAATIQQLYDENESFREQVDGQEGGLAGVVKRGHSFTLGDGTEMSIKAHDGPLGERSRSGSYGPIRAWYAMRAVGGAIGMAFGEPMTQVGEAEEFQSAIDEVDGGGRSSIAERVARKENMQVRMGLAAEQQYGVLMDAGSKMMGRQSSARIVQGAKTAFGVGFSGLMANSLLEMSTLGAIPGLGEIALGAGAVIGGAALFNEGYNYLTGDDKGIGERITGALHLSDNKRDSSFQKQYEAALDRADEYGYSATDAANLAVAVKRAYGEDEGYYALTPSQAIMGYEGETGIEAQTAFDQFSGVAQSLAPYDRQRQRRLVEDMARATPEQNALSTLWTTATDPLRQRLAVSLGQQGASDVAKRWFPTEDSLSARTLASADVAGSYVESASTVGLFAGEIPDLIKSGVDSGAIPLAQAQANASYFEQQLQLGATPQQGYASISPQRSVDQQNVLMSYAQRTYALTGRYSTLQNQDSYLDASPAQRDAWESLRDAVASSGGDVDQLEPHSVTTSPMSRGMSFEDYWAREMKPGHAAGDLWEFYGTEADLRKAYGDDTADWVKSSLYVSYDQEFPVTRSTTTAQYGEDLRTPFMALNPAVGNQAAQAYSLYAAAGLSEADTLRTVTSAYQGLDPSQAKSATNIAEAMYGRGDNLVEQAPFINRYASMLSLPESERYANSLDSLESMGYSNVAPGLAGKFIGKMNDGLWAQAANKMSGTEYTGSLNLADMYSQMGLVNLPSEMLAVSAGYAGVEATTSVGSITQAMYGTGMDAREAQLRGYHAGITYTNPQERDRYTEIGTMAANLGADANAAWGFASKATGLSNQGYRDLRGLLQGDTWSMSKYASQLGLQPLMDVTTGIDAWQEETWQLQDQSHALQLEGQRFSLGENWSQYREGHAMTFGGSFYNPVTQSQQTVPYGQLQISGALYDISQRQQRENLDYQDQQFALSNTYQRQGMSTGYAQQMTRIGWREADWQYQEDTSQLSFGWQMEDVDEALRFAQGRERRQLLKQRDRAVISETMRRGHSEEESDRLETEKQWAEEAHTRQEEYFQANFKLQAERLEKERGYFEERSTWTDRERELSRSQAELSDFHHRKNLEFQTYELQQQEALYQNQLNIDRARTEAQGAFQVWLSNIKQQIDSLGTLNLGSASGGATSASGTSGTNAALGSAWEYAGSSGGLSLYGPAGTVTHKTYKEGGSTGSGPSNEIAGGVHYNEYVVPENGALVLRDENLTSVMQQVLAVLLRLESKGGAPFIFNLKTPDLALRFDDVISLYDQTFQGM